MSFINDPTPPAIQHRNWNLKLGQSSNTDAAAFLIVPGVELGSKWSLGGIAFTQNALNPDDGGNSGWAGGAYGAGRFVVIGSTASAYSLDGITYNATGIVPTPPPSPTVAGNSNFSTYLRSLGRWLYASARYTVWSDDGLNWTAVDWFPLANAGPAASQSRGRFYVAQGQDGAVYSSTGLAGSWTTLAVFPGTNPIVLGFACGAADSAVYAIGTTDISALSRATIWKSTDGVTFAAVYVDATAPDSNLQGMSECAVSDDGTKISAVGIGPGIVFMVYSGDSGASFARSALGASSFANKMIGLQWCAGNFYATKTGGAVFRGATGPTMVQVETSIPAFATAISGPVCNY